MKAALVSTVRRFNAGLRWLSGQSHHMQQRLEWGLPPQPEWFDHYIDQHSHWHTTGNPLWVERGVFSSLAIPTGGNVLELCCGDGFNARHFYAIRARQVVAVDFDSGAIAHARRYNRAPNVRFELSDIRDAMPVGTFDTIIWDAAIEHFAPEEIAAILQSIKDRLSSTGTLTGYTIVEREGGKQLSHHEYEFRSKEDLLRFLTPHFDHVRVFETVYPSRHNLYFWAGHGVIPFADDWLPMVSQTAGAPARR